MIKNHIKTAVLLAVLTGLLLWVGSFWGQSGLMMAFAIAVLMNLGSYWFSDKIILKMYRAQEIDKSDAPELHQMVGEVARKANIPKPSVYLIPTRAPNAFATGRNPKHASIAVTAGITNLLTKNELKGVLAHEISHVKNRDTLIQAVVATIAGAITYIAFFARWAAIFGDEDGGLELLALAILTPIAATLIQLGISRNREYLADKSGAELIGNGKHLASALQKLEKAPKIRAKNKTTSSLFIVNPFSKKGLMSLLSTHPPVEERVKRLNEIG